MNLMRWACALGWHNWTVISVRAANTRAGIGFIERCDWCGKKRVL